MVSQGFKFRTHALVGVNNVLEVNGENAIIRAPNGEILKGKVPDMVKSIMAKEIIPEPALAPKQIATRVWLISKRRMLYDIAGIVKIGADWLTADGTNRHYKVFTQWQQPQTTFKVHESDLVIMYDTGYKTIADELLFEFDVVWEQSSPSELKIVISNGGHYHLKTIGKRMDGTLLTPSHKLTRMGNIFENPDCYDLFVKTTL